jgi:two-component system chemotaxis response regulator CheB
LLVYILNADSRLKVIGTADNGKEALAFLEQKTPDVIVMDIYMPGMDGYKTTRRIMETRPVPIVICSAQLSTAEVANTFQAFEAGALALVAKPVGLEHFNHDQMAAKLINTVVLMSEIKVVRRWSETGRSPVLTTQTAPPPTTAGSKVVAIGVSTGGPPVLKTILSGLPRDFPAPVLIVQHIAPGFLPGMVEWLNQSTGFPTTIAVNGETFQPGHAYLAPDGHHMGLGPQRRIVLSIGAPDNGLRPSVAHLFRSAARVCGTDTIGVLLTGMGRDGANELKILRNAGAFTIAQDAASSVVHGMPGEAIKLDAATRILSPDLIPAQLLSLVGLQAKPSSSERGNKDIL